MQVRRGGRDDAPMLMPYPVNDYGTGMMGAYAVALALHERNRTGRGQSVDSGLALTAGLLQSPYFLDFEGHQRSEPEGRGLRGISAVSRLYSAADGWLYIHCGDKEAVSRMLSVSEFTHLQGLSEVTNEDIIEFPQDGELSKALSAVFATKPVSYWLERLNDAGIDATENAEISNFRDLSQVREAGLIVTRDHPGQGKADHLGNTAHLSATPMRVGRPTPVLGSDADEILADLDLPAGTIASLKERNIIVIPQ